MDRAVVEREDRLEGFELVQRDLDAVLQHEPADALAAGRRGQGTGVGVILAPVLRQDIAGVDLLVLDLDLAFGTAALSLNLQPLENVASALEQPDRLDEVLLDRYMTRVDDHLSVVAAPADLNGFQEPKLESFETLIRLASQMAAFVVLDLPHQWARWVHDVLLVANDVVVTAYPDLANLRDSKQFFENLAPRRGAEAPTRLVFNGVGRSKRTELSAKDFEGAMNVVPVATIPYNPGAFGSVLMSGELLSKGRKGGGGVARELSSLAQMVSGRQQPTKPKSAFSLFGRSK